MHLEQTLEIAQTLEKDFDFQAWIEKFENQLPPESEIGEADPQLFQDFPVESCIALNFLPWQKLGQSVVILDNDENRMIIENRFAHLQEKLVFFKVAEDTLTNRIRHDCAPLLLERSHHLCPSGYSIRDMEQPAWLMARMVLSIAAISTLFLFPKNVIFAVLLAAIVLVTGNSFVRLVAIAMHWRARHMPPAIPSHLPPENGWKTVSLMVPLYREPDVVHGLCVNLSAIEYPEDLLDIKIIIEADDQITKDALAKVTLDKRFDVIEVPVDYLRTKPKAMNFALPYCKGEFVGIYDAEDAPDPLQIKRVMNQFEALSDKKIGAVQCELDFYNKEQNWLTRCFTMEYRVWFATVLPALQKLGFPIPLGGTSVFFRKSVLDQVGAWDAHNVTEDADLGVRLSRLGYETIVIHSRTLEEANSRPLSWIRQRSRWLKGYMLSWMSHMHNPLHLYRDLGFTAFIGMQILFLGAVANYLALPLFWMMWLVMFGVDLFGMGALDPVFRIGLFAVLFCAQLINLTNMFIALRKDRLSRLLPWILTLPFYWPLGAIATYKALIEVIFAPFYWDKTSHGHCSTKGDVRKKRRSNALLGAPKA